MTARASESAQLLIKTLSSYSSAHVLPAALEVGLQLDAAVALAPSKLWVSMIGSLKQLLGQSRVELRVPVSDYMLIPPPSLSGHEAREQATAVALLPGWLDSLDSLTITSWSPLVPWGATDDGVASFERAWSAIAKGIGSVSSILGNKPVVIAQLGFQSRWRCWVSPNATMLPKITDCARHADCYHMACQENGIEGALEALHAQPWLKGLYIYGMTTDPTFGGTYDWSHTVHGKPAETTLRRWFGNYTELEDSSFAAAYVSGISAGNFVASSGQRTELR